jgi:acetyl esterase/lipase
MIMGDRWVGAEAIADWVERYDVVGATVEYRLAPEFPDPVPVEDCYAGLVWFAGKSDELGFDADRILLTGGSAGGGLAAGVALLARDRGTPPIAAQLLDCPMLDDRDSTLSTLQFADIGVWDREANVYGWSSLLGERANTDDVSIYAAPARATDLSGLPPAFLDVGSAEVFRDETIDYASRIWAVGGQAELHVFSGGFHGYEVVSTAAVSRTTLEVREAWVKRYLAD